MDKPIKKALYIGGGIIAGTALAGWLFYEIRLQLIYRKVSTLAEANQLIQTPNTILTDISDPALPVSTDDSTYQYNTTGSDDIDAVEIDGIVYEGDSNTLVYADANGNTYDGNADTITDTDGDVTHIDPDTVIYGTIQEDGSFVADSN